MKENKWISVKDQLPENTKNVLVWQPQNLNTRMTRFSHGLWQFEKGTQARYESVTHWMPLPKPPKP